MSKKYCIFSVTILSQKHLEHRRSLKRMRIPENQELGKRINSDIVLKTTTISPDVFTAPKLNDFDNTCLPVCMIIGYAHKMSQRFQYTRNKKFRPYFKLYRCLQKLRINSQDSSALKHLKINFLKLVSALNLSPTGPFYIENIKQMCDYFNANCTIFSTADQEIIYKYPKRIQFDLPHIFLLYSRDAEKYDLGHVDLIINEKNFFKV